MANSLVITKLSDGSFSFIVNGDTANTIINLRNDLTTVGNEAHFKTSEGANLIKLQQILYNEVTIVDGATLPVATSSIDLRIKLRSVGFWDWLDNSGGGGVDRFDELEDTFQYFGNDGKVTMVDESQLKLVPFQLPDVSYLDLFPKPLIALKAIRVNALANAYELYDAINIVTQTINLGATTTAPSEDIVRQALDLKANASDVPSNTDQILNNSDVIGTTTTDALNYLLTNGVNFPKIQITATAGQTIFALGTSATANAVFWNGALLNDLDWSQTGTNITTTFPLSEGDLFKPI